MTAQSDLVTTRQAADLLGVTVQQVNRLAKSGDLTRVARGVLDRDSVEAHLAVRQGVSTQAWAEHTAWGAIATLSGLTPNWLGSVQRSRLKSTLRGVTAERFVAQARNRAQVHIYQGHSAIAARLRNEIVVADRGAIGLGAQSLLEARADGYVDAGDVQKIAHRYALRESARGGYVLRATTFDLATVQRITEASNVLASLDAATSRDPRERGVGADVLTESLARWNRSVDQ